MDKVDSGVRSIKWSPQYMFESSEGEKSLLLHQLLTSRLSELGLIQANQINFTDSLSCYCSKSNKLLDRAEIGFHCPQPSPNPDF